MLVRKRGVVVVVVGGGARVGLYYQDLQRWTPFSKYFTLKVIPIIEIVKVLRSCLARKKYCSVFTDLTQDVSIFTGIQPLPHTTNSRTHLCSNPQNSQSACSIIQTRGVDLNIYISYKYRMRLSSINKTLFQKKKS